MNYEEFLKPLESDSENSKTEQVFEEENQDVKTESSDDINEIEEIIVKQAVVESLAAEKVEQEETIEKLQQEKRLLQDQISSLQEEILKLKTLLNEKTADLSKVADILLSNAETTESNKIALLDRDLEVPDRFPGETRDQVLEAISSARETAEKEGRIRRAQVLEGVLTVNEPSGNLAKKRAALEKFFNDNQNILSGPVIAELEKAGISHKKGEDYLLTSEILLRTY